MLRGSLSSSLSFPTRLLLLLAWLAIGGFTSWLARRRPAGWARAAAALPLVALNAFAAATFFDGDAELISNCAHFITACITSLKVCCAAGSSVYSGSVSAAKWRPAAGSGGAALRWWCRDVLVDGISDSAGGKCHCCTPSPSVTLPVFPCQLLAWVMDRGSLTQPLTLPQWLAVYALPIIPADGERTELHTVAGRLEGSFIAIACESQLTLMISAVVQTPDTVPAAATALPEQRMQPLPAHGVQSKAALPLRPTRSMMMRRRSIQGTAKETAQGSGRQAPQRRPAQVWHNRSRSASSSAAAAPAPAPAAALHGCGGACSEPPLWTESSACPNPLD